MVSIEKILKERSIKNLLNFSIINIDKPSGPTSFGVDQIIKKALKLNKTSHFGTLDPMVTGVLPLALGRACKLMPYFIGKEKTYVGVMNIHNAIERSELEKEINKFIGKINQLPPKKSRVKRQIREREVYEFKILEQDKKNGKNFIFEAKVEAGTYIRKLIHDLGEKINGAHMLELRRTQASIFNEENSVDIYKFLEAVEEYEKGNEKPLRNILIPGEIIFKTLPVYQIKEKFLKTIYHGSPLRKEMLESIPKENKFLIFYKEDFIGVYEKTQEESMIARPRYILQPL
ncbi:RNA-guided pseudouridylation complex pseudouridine synthase subunit Cbf5 [Candidatus Pacearchaeota archaeon CG10_big_fil_rev_8_21_14_0_10_31_9]|nr:MAG: RNA-guided pseudouridylation complex pseudouridine synthase subunit Cbf5 [Candidatus Pacearchaeota archaeon CG10_big_fil_rev_8_21_14_0_10_31_9]